MENRYFTYFPSPKNRTSSVFKRFRNQFSIHVGLQVCIIKNAGFETQWSWTGNVTGIRSQSSCGAGFTHAFGTEGLCGPSRMVARILAILLVGTITLLRETLRGPPTSFAKRWPAELASRVAWSYSAGLLSLGPRRSSCPRKPTTNRWTTQG